MFLITYVDDCLLLGRQDLIDAERDKILETFPGRKIEKCKENNAYCYDFLGVTVEMIEEKLFLHQKKINRNQKKRKENQ